MQKIKTNLRATIKVNYRIKDKSKGDQIHGDGRFDFGW